MADEIIYDIPGGMTARNTYDIRRGKCDTYSLLLAAFCRAVGIPARVVWGGMYTPQYGGGFIQHAWNEVYMGDVGWIAVDSTAEEVDYIDSSHIRIGILSSKTAAFNPLKMEILDYRPQSGQPITDDKSLIPNKYLPLLGEYRSDSGPYKGKDIKVSYGNHCLAIEMPGRGILELKEADQNGFWFFKASRSACVSFDKDETAAINGLALWIRTRLPKKKTAETNKTDVPKEFLPYLGIYPVPMEGFELEVIFQENNLAVIEAQGEIVKLTGPDEKGLWIYKSDEYKISFIFENKEDVKAMTVHQIYKIPRIKNTPARDRIAEAKRRDK